jgi:hypothetical protein
LAIRPCMLVHQDAISKGGTMYSRTPWRIMTWNSESVGGSIRIGLAAGSLELGLAHGSESHTLHCVGISGSMGYGVSIRGFSLPNGALGFQSDIRTQGGTLYKNNLAITGELTLEDLRTSSIGVLGAELNVMDVGEAGYLVIFASNAATLSTILGGGGVFSEALAVVTCRALTFLAVGQAGLPNAALAGYRYMVL